MNFNLLDPDLVIEFRFLSKHIYNKYSAWQKLLNNGTSKIVTRNGKAKTSVQMYFTPGSLLVYIKEQKEKLDILNGKK